MLIKKKLPTFTKTNDSLGHSQKPTRGNTLTPSISMIHLQVPLSYILVSQIISQSQTLQLKFHMHFLHLPPNPF